MQNAFDRKLDTWLQNIPDYSTVSEAYHVNAEIKSRMAKIRREIEKTDEDAIKDLKPRSNEARITRQQATRALRDELSQLEQALCESENEIRLLEYQKGMFSSATYVKRMKDIL